MKNSHMLAATAALVIVSNYGATDASLAQSGVKKTPPPLMKVNWKNREIQQFIQERATNPPQSVGPQDQAELSRLNLPVIAFDRPPGIVRRAFGIAKLPQRKRALVTEPGNPNWYTITDTYEGLTITVEADLRVQQQLPADTKIYTPPAGLAATPEVNLMERKVDEGMEGLIAEYTVYKFPDIPYRVTIECAPATKQHCADMAAIQQDRSALRIISARPPK